MLWKRYGIPQVVYNQPMTVELFLFGAGFIFIVVLILGGPHHDEHHVKLDEDIDKGLKELAARKKTNPDRGI